LYIHLVNIGSNCIGSNGMQFIYIHTYWTVNKRNILNDYETTYKIEYISVEALGGLLGEYVPEGELIIM